MSSTTSVAAFMYDLADLRKRAQCRTVLCLDKTIYTRVIQETSDDIYAVLRKYRIPRLGVTQSFYFSLIKPRDFGYFWPILGQPQHYRYEYHYHSVLRGPSFRNMALPEQRALVRSLEDSNDSYSTVESTVTRALFTLDQTTARYDYYFRGGL